MADAITAGRILVEEGTHLPNSLLLQSESSSNGWALVKNARSAFEKAIQEASFRSDCTGKTVVLMFDFKVAGRPSGDPKQSVSFGYPNKFWIVTEPSRP